MSIQNLLKDIGIGWNQIYLSASLISDGEDEDGAPPADPRDGRDKREVGTNPPESVFKKLEPNKNRYSLINKDEL